MDKIGSLKYEVDCPKTMSDKKSWGSTSPIERILESLHQHMEIILDSCTDKEWVSISEINLDLGVFEEGAQLSDQIEKAFIEMFYSELNRLIQQKKKQGEVKGLSKAHNFELVVQNEKEAFESDKVLGYVHGHFMFSNLNQIDWKQLSVKSVFQAMDRNPQKSLSYAEQRRWMNVVERLVAERNSEVFDYQEIWAADPIAELLTKILGNDSNTKGVWVKPEFPSLNEKPSSVAFAQYWKKLSFTEQVKVMQNFFKQEYSISSHVIAKVFLWVQRHSTSELSDLLLLKMMEHQKALQTQHINTPSRGDFDMKSGSSIRVMNQSIQNLYSERDTNVLELDELRGNNALLTRGFTITTEEVAGKEEKKVIEFLSLLVSIFELFLLTGTLNQNPLKVFIETDKEVLINHSLQITTKLHVIRKSLSQLQRVLFDYVWNNYWSNVLEQQGVSVQFAIEQNNADHLFLSLPEQEEVLGWLRVFSQKVSPELCVDVVMLLQPGSTKQMYNPTEVNTFRGFLEVYRTMTIPMVRSHLGNLLSEKVLQLLDSFLDLRKIQRLSLAELKAQVDSKLSKEVNTVEDLLKSYLNSDVDIERNELLFLIHEVQVVLKSVPVQHFKGGSHKNLSFLIGVLDRMLVNEMRNQTSGLETKKTSGALEVNTKEEQLYVWRNDEVGKRFSEEGTLARLQRGVHSWREEILEKITPVKEAFQSEKLFGAGFGIVLIAKYFTKVFRKYELLNEKGRFSSKHHQYRALFFLKYLIYGRVSLKDDDLAIRLLLGITTDEVIRHKDLHADEKKDMEGLLSSVLHHWKGSGSTTVATLRSHFLQRKGGCYPEDKGYLWRVEKAPYDVLLKTLPWGYEQLFFQWLNFKIHVIW